MTAGFDADPRGDLWKRGYTICASCDDESSVTLVFTGNTHCLNVYLNHPFVYRSIGCVIEFEYSTIAQGFFHQRAMCANDHFAAAKILTELKPNYEQISVDNLCLSTWNNVREAVMESLILASYRQTYFLKKRLLATKEAKLVYVSGNVSERLWSCGLRFYDSGIASCEKHTGTNKLGAILEKVRAKLRIENAN